MADKTRREATAELEANLQVGRSSLDEVRQNLSLGLERLRTVLAEAEKDFGAKSPEVLTMRAEIERTEREMQHDLGQANREMNDAVDEARRMRSR